MSSTVLLAADVWSYELHPEVWLVVGAIAALGVYAVRAIGPLVVTDGSPIVTRRQAAAFWVAVVALFGAASWPMHDIAEEALYSVHAVQHLLIVFIIPPLFLIAMPEWLARLVILDDSRAARVLRVLTRPLVAGIVFNVLQVLNFWTVVVNYSTENGAFHYSMHLAMFLSAVLMWFPVMGPLPELQMSEPGKMLYLFLMSIVPTVPAAWLTFAEGSVYAAYDHADRLWGISVTSDQQAAGFVTKVVGGFYLWGLIALRFFRYATGQRAADDDRRRRVVAPRVLSSRDVERALAEAGDAPAEPVLGG